MSAKPVTRKSTPMAKAFTSLEGEPEFAIFLEFLAKDALAHPEALVDAGGFRERDRGLLPSKRV